MRIDRLELKGVGPFDDAVLEIPPPRAGQRGELVIFEGPNGSGKSTIAQAIVHAIDRPPFSGHPAGGLRAPLEFPTRHRSPSSSLSVRVLHNDEERIATLRPQDQGSRLGTEAGDAGERARSLRNWSYAGWTGSLEWAAFAFGGHRPTPRVDSKGPTPIGDPPTAGALSFGTAYPASAQFGQLLVNLDQEVAKAFREGHRENLDPAKQAQLKALAASRQGTIDSIARAISTVLGRKVVFDVPIGEHAPRVSFDGEEIPLDLLGEGMRSTLAWLTDLLVRLHRIEWTRRDISPFEQDFWLVLDEVDESLHPTMQMRLIPALRSLFPNARMYVTTHSPFVVASAAEGYVFAIRPDANHRVSGTIEPRALEHGQSLEWVIEEIFEAETGFIDPWTRSALRAHREDVARLRRREVLDGAAWRAFLDRRGALLRLSEQVQTVVAMQEVTVLAVIEERLAREAARAAS